MKPIKIEQGDMKKAVQSGNAYIQVGKKKFLLLEVDEVNDKDCYVVSDPEEEKQLIAALDDNNPVLSEEDIQKMLGH